MVRATAGAILIALLTTCARPTLVPRPTQPVRISVAFSEARPDREALEARWSQALEDRLAAHGILRRGMEGGAASDAPELRVTVTAVMARGDVVKQTAARAFGASVREGAEAATQEDNHPRQFVGGALVGAIVGVVVAPVAATTVEGRALFHNARLGYKPRHLVCKVTFHPVGGGEVQVLETTGWEVIKAMRPLTEAQLRVEGALAQEEARALAQVVGETLEREHHWTPRPAPAQP